MDPPIGAPRWKPVTQLQNSGVFTRYILACRRRGQDGGLAPDRVRAWIQELEVDGCCTRTIAGYLWSLHKVATVVLPESPRWLVETCRRIDRVALMTPKRKSNFVVPAAAILDWGLQMIALARAAGPGDWTTTQRFRDGLILVVGIYMPERRRALAGLSLDDLDLRNLTVTFPATLTKGEVVSARAIPEVVAGLLAEWITDWRSLHTRNLEHRALWIGKGGSSLKPDALCSAMKQATRSAPWGYPITPHRLRDAAATCAVEAGPEFAPLASIVLGHRSERTTAHYIETAKCFLASRKVQQIIDDARRQLLIRVRRECIWDCPCSERWRRAGRRRYGHRE